MQLVKQVPKFNFAFVYEGDRRAIYEVNGIGVSLAIMEIGKRNQLPVLYLFGVYSLKCTWKWTSKTEILKRRRHIVPHPNCKQYSRRWGSEYVLSR